MKQTLEYNQNRLEQAAGALRMAAACIAEASGYLRDSDVGELADGKLLDRLGDVAASVTEGHDTVMGYRNVVIDRIEHPDPFDGINR